MELILYTVAPLCYGHQVFRHRKVLEQGTCAFRFLSNITPGLITTPALYYFTVTKQTGTNNLCSLKPNVFWNM